MTGRTGIIALLTAAIAGPAAALAWPAMIKWPIVIGYEVILFVIALVGGIAGELRTRWQARAADRLDKALVRRFTRFDKRYREYVLSNLRFIDLKGLTTTGFYTPDLDEVFVDVSLDYRAPHQVPSGLLGDLPPDAENRHSISDFLNRRQPAVLAVLGAPGSGKTTLLRHTARRVFENKHRNVPVLLYLRDHVSAIAEDPGVPLSALIRRSLGSYFATEPADWFDQKLRQGDCVVLLDGLDEIARQEDRRRVADWVELQIKHYPQNDFVLTSRPHGYRSAPVEGATVLQVRSFTGQQVRTFVHGWYRAVVRHTTKGTPDEVHAVATSEAEDLLSRLDDSPALADLTVNPLLLTMIANVHRYRGALPGSRADLYHEICQVMLWRRQEAKKLRSDLDGAKKEALLRGLAFTMMQRKVRDLREDDVLAEFRTGLRRISRKVTAGEFLADVGSNGLLVERESGLYSFAHHTFQEYLAASHVREKGLVGTLADNVDDIWWRETTLLYTARSDADAIVHACLKSGTVTALSLAFDCAEQDSELDPDLRDGLENLLTEAFVPDAEQDRRRLVAAVLLTRHLRHTVRAGNEGWVCTRPVTNKIYALFRKDVPGPAPDGPGLLEPDDNPVAGVRWTDAVEFSLWAAAEVVSHEKSYQLPRRTQIDEPAVRRAIGGSTRSVWLSAAEPGDKLWVPPGTADPRLVSPAAQRARIEHDLRFAGPALARLIVLYLVVCSRLIPHRDARRLAGAFVETLGGRRHTDLDTALDQSFIMARVAAHDIRNVDYAQAEVLALHVNRLRGGQGSVLPENEIDAVLELVPSMTITDVESEVDVLLATQRTTLHEAAVRFATNWDQPGPDEVRSAMGKALSEAIAQAYFAPPRASRQPSKRGGAGDRETGQSPISSSFAEVTSAAETTFVVDLDDLCNIVLNLSAFPPEFEWATGAARRFAELAIPVFDRTTKLTAERATALRLTALALSAEADDLRHNEMGETYRMLAAAVTLIELRATGESPAHETIVLAAG